MLVSSQASFVSNSALFTNDGLASPKMQRILEIAGLIAKQFDDAYPALHVVNLNDLLQTSGCYQRDFDHYKKGGNSALELTLERATQLLDFEYSTRESLMPKPSQNPVDGIMCSGVFPHSLGATLFKRLNSLKASAQEIGLKYRTVHIACKNEEIKELTRQFIETQKEQLPDMDFNYVVATDEANIGISCFQQLNDSEYLQEEFVVISDGTSFGKDLQTAHMHIKDRKCLGVASAPIKDWKEDMNFYGYTEALGTSEKAAIAWARAEMIFKAREVNQTKIAYIAATQVSL